MIVFPNCKINLGLHILRKRTDGFHDLETVFYPLPLRDALEIVPSQETLAHGIDLTVSGGLGFVPAEKNICFKAYQLLKRDFPKLGSVRMHLHKVIPSGAGLGGGSADGSFALVALNAKFRLGLTEEELIPYALELGSDCPFFLRNRPVLARGRGEAMQDIALDLSSYTITVVNPRIHVNTGWAFSQLAPKADRIGLDQLITLPAEQWKDVLVNDFEGPICKAHPEIGAIREKLYQQGATYAAMSGSGSTVFGLFPKNTRPELPFPSHYFMKTV